MISPLLAGQIQYEFWKISWGVTYMLFFVFLPNHFLYHLFPALKFTKKKRKDINLELMRLSCYLAGTILRTVKIKVRFWFRSYSVMQLDGNRFWGNVVLCIFNRASKIANIWKSNNIRIFIMILIFYSIILICILTGEKQ